MQTFTYELFLNDIGQLDAGQKEEEKKNLR